MRPCPDDRVSGLVHPVTGPPVLARDDLRSTGSGLLATGSGPAARPQRLTATTTSAEVWLT